MHWSDELLDENNSHGHYRVRKTAACLLRKLPVNTSARLLSASLHCTYVPVRYPVQVLGSHLHPQIQTIATTHPSEEEWAVDLCFQSEQP
jgi:hypothetical protein